MDAAALPPLEPEARALDADPEGTPTVLADGRCWILADYVPRLGGVWDTLYDSNVGRGKYRIADVRTACLRLLRANYAVTEPEGFDLISGADPIGLVAAVESAMLPMAELSAERTLSRWAESALRSVGLDPETIPGRIRNEVLEHLEHSGRIVPRTLWIGSHHAAARRTALLKNASPAA